MPSFMMQASGWWYDSLFIKNCSSTLPSGLDFSIKLNDSSRKIHNLSFLFLLSVIFKKLFWQPFCCLSVAILWPQITERQQKASKNNFLKIRESREEKCSFITIHSSDWKCECSPWYFRIFNQMMIFQAFWAKYILPDSAKS